MSVKILALNGSLRNESWNYKLVRNAGFGAEQEGATVTYLHLKDLPMPVFSEDLEKQQGLEANAKAFKKLLIEHDGLLIASPEYNSSITAALKNAIDWASRAEGDEPPLLAYKNKVAAIMSASPGALGGLRGLVHLRAILGNIGVMVVPEQHALGQAYNQFDENDQLTDEALRGKVMNLGRRVFQVCSALQTS